MSSLTIWITGKTAFSASLQTKLGGADDTPDVLTVIQNALNKMKNWVNRNLRKIQKREMPNPAPGEK